MTLDEMLEFAAPVLTGGAVIILGFLSFSGIYVLWPILPVCILAFFLSVGFEGEIYYQNIKHALEKLFKPNYLKRQLAHECLRDFATKIELCDHLEHIIHKLNNSFDNSSLIKDYETFLELFEKLTERYDLKEKQNLENNLLSLDDFKNSLPELSNSNKCIESSDQKFLSSNSLAPKNNNHDIKIQLNCLLTLMKSNNDDYPPFFNDFIQLTRLHHKYDKTKLNDKNQQEKELLEKNINSLKNLFMSQLFLDNNTQKITTIDSCIEVVATDKVPYIHKNCKYAFIEEENILINKSDPESNDFSDFKLSEPGNKLINKLVYENKLQQYLKNHQNKWQAKLEERKYLFMLVQMVSSLAGIFMILGTTFLLVEAFAVLPFISLIPLGFWPILIVPMAVIAGLAFGFLTYNAITDMINNDIILKRYYKIKSEIKSGITLSKGLMIAATVILFAITIALTVCTAGTWWSVIKHTRPLFIWMGKIPPVFIGIISATLGFAALMFNWVNSDQTLTEFSEIDTTSKPHPYDLHLLEVEDANNYMTSNQASKNQRKLIKGNNQYWLSGYKDKKWEWSKINGTFIYHIDIDSTQKTLPYSIVNLNIYLTIIFHRAHTFIPSKENWWQIFNPARILLIVTYAPLLGILFIGHLISIAATFDRLPRVDEFISIVVGFLADFVEDITYFEEIISIFLFGHSHREDIRSLMDEQESLGHNHDDNLPAWALKKLFFPLFYLAAWWHIAMRDNEPDLISASISENDTNAKQSQSLKEDFDNIDENSHKAQNQEYDFWTVVDLMQGIKPAEEVTLDTKQAKFIKFFNKDEDPIEIIANIPQKDKLSGITSCHVC